MNGYNTRMNIHINYEVFIIKLNINAFAGLEQYTTTHIIEDYVTK